MRCVQCGNSRASRSHRKTPWDWFLSGWSVYPYRCGACETRFHARYREQPEAHQVAIPTAQSAPDPKPVRRRKRKPWLHRVKERIEIRKEKRKRIAIQALVYGAALLAFIVVVYALIQFG